MPQGGLERACVFYRDNERTVRTNFRPHLGKFTLRNPRTYVHTMCVEVGVSTSKFAAPQNTIFPSDDSKPFLDRTEEAANIFVELANMFPPGHLADISGRNVQLRKHALPISAIATTQQRFHQWTQTRMTRKQVTERLWPTRRAVAVTAKTRAIEPVIGISRKAITAPSYQTAPCLTPRLAR